MDYQEIHSILHIVCTHMQRSPVMLSKLLQKFPVISTFNRKFKFFPTFFHSHMISEQLLHEVSALSDQMEAEDIYTQHLGEGPFVLDWTYIEDNQQYIFHI